jgi:flagellar hook-length control protein FliK
MSNGVGILSVLAGSFPAIPSPRRSDPPEASSRRSAGSSDRVEGKSIRTRGTGTPGAPRGRALELQARPQKSRAVVAASPDRKEAAIAGCPSTLHRAGRTPLSASIDRIRVSSPSLLRISLRPAALGELRIELSVRGSVLRARVLTASEEARALILGRLDELRDILESQGIRVRDFRVDVSDAGMENEEDPTSGSRGAEEVREGGPRSHRRQVLDLRV